MSQGLSLTFHSRLFSAHTSATAGEAFLSLAQQLQGFFQGYEGVAVTMAMGIDPADDRALALLQKVITSRRLSNVALMGGPQGLKLHTIVTLRTGMGAFYGLGMRVHTIHCHQVNLLNYCQRKVTSYWLRFYERTVEDMINATFDLLTLGYDRPLQLSPTHFLCLVDPLAQWFTRWTVSEGCGGRGDSVCTVGTPHCLGHGTIRGVHCTWGSEILEGSTV